MDEIAEDYGHGYRGVANRLEVFRDRAEAAEARVAELEETLRGIAIAPCIYDLLGESAGPGLIYSDEDLNTEPCPCPGCRARAALGEEG